MAVLPELLVSAVWILTYVHVLYETSLGIARVCVRPNRPCITGVLKFAQISLATKWTRNAHEVRLQL